MLLTRHWTRRPYRPKEFLQKNTHPGARQHWDRGLGRPIIMRAVPSGLTAAACKSFASNGLLALVTSGTPGVISMASSRRALAVSKVTVSGTVSVVSWDAISP